MNEKKSTEAQKRASIKWQKENYSRIPLDVRPEEKERIKQDAENSGMSVGGYIKQAVAEKRERGVNNLTKNDVIALGHAYGILMRVLGNKYDSAGTKFSNACMRPVAGVTLAHFAAIRKNLITEKIAAEIAAELDAVDINNVGSTSPESVLPLNLQGVFQIAYYQKNSADSKK